MTAMTLNERRNIILAPGPSSDDTAGSPKHGPIKTRQAEATGNSAVLSSKYHLDLRTRRLPPPSVFASERERDAYRKNKSEQSRLDKLLTHIHLQEHVCGHMMSRDIEAMRIISSRYQDRLRHAKINVYETLLKPSRTSPQSPKTSFMENKAAENKSSNSKQDTETVKRITPVKSRSDVVRPAKPRPMTTHIERREVSEPGGAVGLESRIPASTVNEVPVVPPYMIVRSHTSPSRTMMMAITVEDTSLSETTPRDHKENLIFPGATCPTLYITPQIQPSNQVGGPTTIDNETSHSKTLRSHPTLLPQCSEPSSHALLPLIMGDKMSQKASSKSRQYLTADDATGSQSAGEKMSMTRMTHLERRGSFLDSTNTALALKRELRLLERRRSSAQQQPDSKFSFGVEIDREKERFRKYEIKIGQFLEVLKSDSLVPDLSKWTLRELEQKLRI